MRERGVAKAKEMNILLLNRGARERMLHISHVRRSAVAQEKGFNPADGDDDDDDYRRFLRGGSISDYVGGGGGYSSPPSVCNENKQKN